MHICFYLFVACLICLPYLGCSGHAGRGGETPTIEPATEVAEEATFAEPSPEGEEIHEIAVHGEFDEMSDSAGDGSIQDGEEDLHESPPPILCTPGTVANRFGVRLRCNEDGTAWLDDPCPGGTYFDGHDCVPNRTVVVLIADTYLQPSPTFLGHVCPRDLMCAFREWAQQSGAQWFQPEMLPTFECDPPEPYFTLMYWQMFPAMVSFFVRKIVEGLSDVPNLHVVLMRPAMRTRHPEFAPKDPLDLLGKGYYQPYVDGCPPEYLFQYSSMGDYVLCMDLPDVDHPSPDSVCPGLYCECAGYKPNFNTIAERLSASVVGYPDPFSLSKEELLRWVDLKEDVADTGIPCADDKDCGLGTCYQGTCWTHIDPEIRGIEFGKPGQPSGMLLLGVSELSMLETEGFPCHSTEDCKPFGKCVNHRCHDPGFACRRRHLVHLTFPHALLNSGEYVLEVTAARWLRTGLRCETTADCAGGVECVPLEGKEHCFQVPYPPDWKLPEKVCAPPPLPEGLQPPVASTIKGLLIGHNEVIPVDPAPVARAVGPPVRGRVHVVLVPPVRIPDQAAVFYTWVYPIAISVAGGGKVVLPVSKEMGLEKLFGSVAENGWASQIKELIAAIRRDATEHQCTMEDLRGFPEEWLHE